MSFLLQVQRDVFAESRNFQYTHRVWLLFWKGNWALKKSLPSYTFVFQSDTAVASELCPTLAEHTADQVENEMRI